MVEHVPSTQKVPVPHSELLNKNKSYNKKVSLTRNSLDLSYFIPTKEWNPPYLKLCET